MNKNNIVIKLDYQYLNNYKLSKTGGTIEDELKKIYDQIAISTDKYYVDLDVAIKSVKKMDSKGENSLLLSGFFNELPIVCKCINFFGDPIIVSILILLKFDTTHIYNHLLKLDDNILDKLDIILPQYTENVYFDANKEYIITKLLSENKRTSNFVPKIYHTVVGLDDLYNHTGISALDGVKCNNYLFKLNKYIFMEKLTGTDLLSQLPILSTDNPDEILKIYIQATCILYMAKKEINLIHDDMNLGNIFCVPIVKSELIFHTEIKEYKTVSIVTDNKTILIDFGCAGCITSIYKIPFGFGTGLSAVDSAYAFSEATFTHDKHIADFMKIADQIINSHKPVSSKILDFFTQIYKVKINETQHTFGKTIVTNCHYLFTCEYKTYDELVTATLNIAKKMNFIK
ncbi:MAG: hypothetical protein Faunusvirus50_2 [Faunusvirus sp.]|jgi:hypothetical protein|uniref:Protein kinase domain-containing protein n=1 Tax=Faunusvirus sp. TaxID=2487766 RepID=A0A3G4ZXY5_9VIRU|nr:MAG: hypothetical protein Faunusvirus50_2 [Faunusvirus sp.]